MQLLHRSYIHTQQSTYIYEIISVLIKNILAGSVKLQTALLRLHERNQTNSETSQATIQPSLIRSEDWKKQLLIRN